MATLFHLYRGYQTHIAANLRSYYANLFLAYLIILSIKKGTFYHPRPNKNDYLNKGSVIE